MSNALSLVEECWPGCMNMIETVCLSCISSGWPKVIPTHVRPLAFAHAFFFSPAIGT